jgi:hypothetical protein
MRVHIALGCFLAGASTCTSTFLAFQGAVSVFSIGVRLEERVGFLSNTKLHVDKLMDTYGKSDFYISMDEGVKYVSENPAYHVSTVSVKATNDVLLFSYVAAEIVQTFGAIISLAQNLPTTDIGKAKLYFLEWMAKFCKDDRCSFQAQFNIIAEIAGTLKNGFRRELLTYSMQIQGIWKYIQETVIPFLFAEAEEFLSSAAKIIIPVATTSVGSSFILSTLMTVMSHSNVPNRKFKDNCGSNFNCYVFV